MFGAWLLEKWCSGFGDVGVLVWRSGALGVERLSTKAGAFTGTFRGVKCNILHTALKKTVLFLHSLKSRRRRKKERTVGTVKSFLSVLFILICKYRLSKMAV